ncbi:MAG: YopX family protein [Bacteroidota bacterium]
MSKQFAPSPKRFRVWDWKTLHRPGDSSTEAELYPDGGSLVKRRGLGDQPVASVDIAWLQSTGLRDVDDVEVFEGDLVEYDRVVRGRRETVVCTVEMHRGGWRIMHRAHGLNEPSLDLSLLFHASVRVVGNVFENPELVDG